MNELTYVSRDKFCGTLESTMGGVVRANEEDIKTVGGAWLEIGDGK